MTETGESPLMDRWSEGILQTLVEIAPSVLEHADDYDSMANYMLCATMGLNGFIAMGVTEDWATHQIGHELTAINGLTHGHTLAIVFPGLLKVLRDQKMGKILQYGERVWGIHDGTPEERAPGRSMRRKTSSARSACRPACTRWGSAKIPFWRSSAASTSEAWPSVRDTIGERHRGSSDSRGR